MNTIKLISGDQNICYTPSKVLCIGRNYVDHIKELGNEVPDEMVVFIKPNSAITTSVNSHHLSEQLHYEGELCFLYEQGRFVAIGFGLDLTKRAQQSVLKGKGLPWERAKAFDGAAVLSDFVLIENNETHFNLSLSINNDIKQSGGTSLMMYQPETILKELQRFTTLEDGDVVMTGTPKGVGVINTGDHFEALVTVSEESQQSAENKVLLACEWVAK